MIYTCYEMIRDCRADRDEGWRYFISNYVPMIRKLLAHYGAEQPVDVAVLNRVVTGLRRPESSMFQYLEPAPERWFVAELRQKVLAGLESSPAGIAIDLETVAAALEPLTLVEKQATWLETMAYAPAAAGAMLRMAPQTVEKIREKAATLVRAKVDAWRRTLLEENGVALGRAASAASTPECLTAKTFLDVLDGRATWSGREQMEQHVTRCWHCIDHFCRMVEVVESLRGVEPLGEGEAEPFRKLLGIRAEKPRGWKRWLAGGA